MTNETETSRKEILLTGRENYLAWSTSMTLLLSSLANIGMHTNQSRSMKLQMELSKNAYATTASLLKEQES